MRVQHLSVSVVILRGPQLSEDFNTGVEAQKRAEQRPDARASAVRLHRHKAKFGGFFPFIGRRLPRLHLDSSDSIQMGLGRGEF